MLKRDYDTPGLVQLFRPVERVPQGPLRRNGGNSVFRAVPRTLFFLSTFSSCATSSHNLLAKSVLPSYLAVMIISRSGSLLLRRQLSTSAPRLAPSRLRSRPSDSASSTSASQPVFKRNTRPPPPAPIRPIRSTTPPTTPQSKSQEAEEVNQGRGGKKGGILSSYKALPYNTKLVFWTCGAGKFSHLPLTFLVQFSNADARLLARLLTVFGVLGLLAADKLEELFPARNHRPSSSSSTSTQDGSAKYIEHKPKLFSISVVDRNPTPSQQTSNQS